MEFAEAKSGVDKVVSDFSAIDRDLNEADTRFRIIDRILFECLGWPRGETHMEKSQGQEFSDYELSVPVIAILEAKRTGITFRVPIATRPSLFRRVSDIASASTECEKAINQVCSYCINRGAEIAIASNGDQIIALRASRVPSVANESYCIVFQNLKHFGDGFFDAWQYLSYPALLNRTILTKLDNFTSALPPEKLSARIPNYPQGKAPTDMHRSMLDIAELLLLNVNDQSDVEQQFFESCYCESGALNQHSLITKQMLNARYASLFPHDGSEAEPHPVAGRKNPYGLTPEILTEAISNRPIALVGDVGVGKTSFLKHLMYVSAYREFRKAIYIYIDLGRRGALYGSARDLILDSIENALLNNYEIDITDADFVLSVYEKEVERFDNTLWGRKKSSDPLKYEEKLIDEISRLQANRSGHARRSIQHLAKSRKKQIIIAIDNADQRSVEVQQEAFVIAQNLASDWDATIFISIRPRTFYYSKRAGALSAYPHRVFTISPPRIDEVIDRRLRFAIKIAEGKVSLARLQAINLQLGGIAALLGTLQDAVDKNIDVKVFLENITGGNIRELIQFLAGFFGNPNIDLNQIVEVLQHGDEFHLPIHEFWKVALRGDAVFFDPDRVLAMNLFDIPTDRAIEHFLAPLVLGLLNENNVRRSKEGFVFADVVVEQIRQLGFSEGSIWWSLRGLTNKKLIEPPERVTFEEDSENVFGDMRSAFRITTLGAYHLRHWISSFNYLDAICVDTPITNRDVRDRIALTIRSHSLHDRYQRALTIKEYFTSVWDSSGLSTSYFDWRAACKQGEETFEKVRRALVRR